MIDAVIRVSKGKLRGNEGLRDSGHLLFRLILRSRRIVLSLEGASATVAVPERKARLSLDTWHSTQVFQRPQIDPEDSEPT